MKKTLMILGICLLVPFNCFSMDKSIIGFYKNPEFNKDSDCYIELTDEVEGLKDDMISFECLQKNKFDFNFGYYGITPINKNEYNIIFKNKIVGKMVVNGDIITISPNLKLIDSLDERLSICNGREYSTKERKCEKGTDEQLEYLSSLVSKMKFKKQN